MYVLLFLAKTKFAIHKGGAKAVTHPRKATICNSLFSICSLEISNRAPLSSHLLHHQPVKRALKAIFLVCLPLCGGVRPSARTHAKFASLSSLTCTFTVRLINANKPGRPPLSFPAFPRTVTFAIFNCCGVLGGFVLMDKK